MLDLNPTTLQRVINSARRATEELENNPYICRQDNDLLIGSPSGQIYETNGACQCTTYLVGQPCWHRAAARLVKRHDEAIACQAAHPSYEEARAALLECFG